MAIIFMDSFDHYSDADYNKKWTGKVGASDSTSINGSHGRFGTSGIYGQSGRQDGSFYKNDLPSSQVYIVGCAYAYLQDPGTNQIWTIRDMSTSHISLRIDSTRKLYVYNHATSSSSSYSSVILTISSWYYIEMKVKIDSTNGGVWVKVNGIDQIKLGAYADTPMGLDTLNGSGSAIANSVVFGSSGGSSFSWHGDDIYVCDDSGSVNKDFLGDIRVEYLVPTGAGVKTQFTPSTGSNWQTVDEVTPSDTDYNSSSTLGAMDLFGMKNLAGNGLVYGVQTVLQSKKDDAGFRRVKPAFFKAGGIGGTDRYYMGTQSPVSDTFDLAPTQIFATSPDTGVVWTVDEVNALQYGYAVGDAGMFTLDAKLV